MADDEPVEDIIAAPPRSRKRVSGVDILSAINDLKDTLNDITVLKQNENRTPLEETKLVQLRELQRAIVKKIINLKDDYLTIDNQFADELERARNRVHRCPSPCDWLKT